MSPSLRRVVPALVVVAVIAAGVLLAAGGAGTGKPGASALASGIGGSPVPGASGGGPTVPPSPTPRPDIGGTELLGYLPYWQMTDAVAAYLEQVPLTTLAMFSVSARRNGEIDTRDPGYKRIAGDFGRRIIAAAHDRGTKVELVFTSFGADRNGIFFGRLPAPGPSPSASTNPEPSPQPTETQPAAVVTPPWQVTAISLALLAQDLGVDGINVDVEQLDELDRDAYGAFLRGLRSALGDIVPGATLSVAAEAGLRGTGNALTAVQADVDRIFLMGYDYHWSGSQPGASAPIDRSDGLYTLRWSIEQYVAAGVPRDHILLGLPLYGMTWRTEEPDRRARVLGRGSTWIPNRHTDVLLDPSFLPGRDPLEMTEYFVRPDGDAWRLTFYDSPATLRAKLALARDQGLAGGGFWAIGYERGLPGYLELMRDFRDGKVARDQAPAAP
jgi:hypothetical protein